MKCAYTGDALVCMGGVDADGGGRVRGRRRAAVREPCGLGAAQGGRQAARQADLRDGVLQPGVPRPAAGRRARREEVPALP